MDTAEKVVLLLKQEKQSLATAESCTGGLLGACLTSVPGASSMYAGGVIAYANEIKTNLLNVPIEMIVSRGAVSEEVAMAMALGARKVLHTDWGIATTGVAGPDGGSKEKPVGTVFIALSHAKATKARRLDLGPIGRDKVREETVRLMLEWVFEVIDEKKNSGNSG